MNIIKQLLKFWIVIVFGCAGAYLLLYNQEPIYVNLPGIGEFKIMTAIAFIACFFVGATTVVIHFSIDLLKKSIELRTLKKKLKSYEHGQYQANQHKNSPLPITVAPHKKIDDKFPPEGEIF